MKHIYLLFLLIMSFNLSNQLKTLSEMAVVKLKCFFSTEENINSIIEVFSSLFDQGVSGILSKIVNLSPIIKSCMGVDIYEIIEKYLPFMQSFQVQQQYMLNNIQNYNAPLLLRKYLYDTAVKTDIIKAKKECIDITKMVPYDKFKNICNLFEFKEK